MVLAVFLAIYLGTLIFICGCIARILQYNRLPMHLRWELYPVPHEEPQRAAHGGSYFESGNWWFSRQSIYYRGDLLAMTRELLLLRGLWEFNRRLWLPSFLFHFGLYLTIASIGCAVSGAFTSPAALALLLNRASLWIGFLGILCVLLGACWLLIRRIVDPGLANYTRPADIFNLIFFIAAFGFVAAGLLRTPEHGTSLAAGARALFHFDRSIHIDPLFAAGLVLAAALVAYIPFTHMSHFIAKYFTWHEVRWDDRRNERGSAIEKEMAGNLQYKPTWAAPHLHPDGQHTWAEIAAEHPAQEKRP